MGSERVFGFIGNHKDCYAPKAVRTSSYIAGRLEIHTGNQNLYPHVSQESIQRSIFSPLVLFPKRLLFKMSASEGEKPTSLKGGGGKSRGLRVESSVSDRTSGPWDN